MKTIKRITAIILIFIALIFIGELYQFYIFKFQSPFSYATFYLDAYKEEHGDISDEFMVNDILQAKEEHNVNVMTITSRLINDLKLEVNVYADEAFKEILSEKYFMDNGIYKSLFSGYGMVNIIHLEDISKYEDMSKVNTFYLMGDDDDLAYFTTSLTDYAGTFPRGGNSNDTTKMIALIWILVVSIITFLSFLDIVLSKKEYAIRMILGEDTRKMIFKLLIGDSLIYIIGFISIIIFLSRWTYTYFYWHISVLGLLVLILFNALPTFGLLKLSIRESMSNSKSQKKLLVLSKFTRFLICFITGAILSSNILVIREGINLYSQRELFEEYRDYSYVQIHFDTSNLNNFDYRDDPNFIVRENFYRKFYDDFNATEFVASEILGKKVVFLNTNSLKYLSTFIPDIEQRLGNSKYSILYPNNENVEKEMPSIQGELASLEGCLGEYAWQPNEDFHDYELIKYSEKVKLVSVDGNYIYGSEICRNPIMVINNEDPSTLGELEEGRFGQTHFMWNTFYRVDRDKLEKYNIEMQRKYGLKTEIAQTNAYDKYIYNWSLVKKVLFVNIFLSVLMISMTVFSTKLLLRFEFELNGVERMLKKILGYTLWERNKFILKPSIAIYAIEVLIALVFMIVTRSPRAVTFGIGILIAISIDLLVTAQTLNKMEKVNTVKVLKGGTL